MIASNSPIRVFVDVNLRKVVGKGSFDSQNTTRISNLSLSLTSIIEGSIEAKKENRENWLSHRMKKMIYTHCIEGYIYICIRYIFGVMSRKYPDIASIRSMVCTCITNYVYMYYVYVLILASLFLVCFCLSLPSLSVCMLWDARIPKYIIRIYSHLREQWYTRS